LLKGKKGVGGGGGGGDGGRGGERGEGGVEGDIAFPKLTSLLRWEEGLGRRVKRRAVQHYGGAFCHTPSPWPYLGQEVNRIVGFKGGKPDQQKEGEEESEAATEIGVGKPRGKRIVSRLSD